MRSFSFMRPGMRSVMRCLAFFLRRENIDRMRSGR